MDAGTATLYAGIIGAVALVFGAVIGFMAEPIKGLFDRKSQKAVIRESLYREMVANYLFLLSVIRRHESPGTPKSHVGTGSVYVLENLHQECFQHVLKQSPIEFYQLEESPTIN